MNKNFLEPQNYQKLSVSRPIYFKIISAHRFEDLISTNKLEIFFSRKVFFNDLELFHGSKTTNLGFMFLPKLLSLECDCLILTQYQEHALKIHLEKQREKSDFTLLNLVPTVAITFVALGDEICSPQIHRPKFVARAFPPIAHIQ